MKVIQNFCEIPFYSTIINYKPKKILIKDPKIKISSVLIPLIKEKKEYFILFIKRTKILKYHKGEVSFPGGVKEEKDKDLKSTVLREVKEEIGINKNFIKVIGQLDDVLTITNFLIRPYVGFILKNFTLRINEQEVEKIIYIPLKILLDQVPHRQLIFFDNKILLTLSYYYKNFMIWGASAKILYNFIRILRKKRK